MSKHKVLIIGGTGYIGSALMILLNETPDFECYALVRPTSEYILPLKKFCNNVIVCKSNNITKQDISTALAKYAITCVVSLVQRYSHKNDINDIHGSADKVFKQNENYCDNLLNASHDYDPNMLVITTSGNFSLWTDDMRNITISPTSSNTPIPVNKYKNKMVPIAQIAHIYTDNYIKNNFIDKGYNVIITYPCSVYGPSPINRNGVWDIIITDLINNENSEFNYIRNIFTSWIDVRDCSAAYRQIIKYGQKGNYYLIGNESFHVTDILMKLTQNTNLKYPQNMKQKFQSGYKAPIDHGIKWDVQSTNKKIHFKPIYSLKDDKTINEWINALNYHYFSNVVKSKL